MIFASFNKNYFTRPENLINPPKFVYSHSSKLNANYFSLLHFGSKFRSLFLFVTAIIY